MSMHKKTVIIALDGSSDARVALPVGRALALLEGATPHLVHVSSTGCPPAEMPAELQLDAAQIEGSILESLAGPPAQAIVQAARDWHASLIVLCTHTALSSGQDLLGHVAAEVLRAAPCPVVLVRPEHRVDPWELREMLLPYDGAPSSAVASGPAVYLARKAQAALSVLHVAASASQPEEGTIRTPRYADQAQYEWPAWAQEFLERFHAECPHELPAKVKLLLAAGVPESEIVRHAAERRLDLVALAWKGSFHPGHALVLQAVIRDAPCPVMVFKTRSVAPTGKLRARAPEAAAVTSRNL